MNFIKRFAIPFERQVKITMDRAAFEQLKYSKQIDSHEQLKASLKNDFDRKIHKPFERFGKPFGRFHKPMNILANRSKNFISRSNVLANRSVNFINRSNVLANRSKNFMNRSNG